MVYKVVQQSAVIKPSATLGVVNAGLKVSICRLGSEHFLTASVGSSFHIYDCDDLQLQYLSRPLKGPISAVLSVGEFTIVSVEAELLIFHKMVVVATLEGHTSRVEHMSSIGDSLLVSVGGAEVFVWQLPKLSKKWSGEQDQISLKPLRELKVGFAVSGLISVPTYVNKILLGGSSGELELWNVNRGEKLYSFHKGRGSAITALASAPALDIVGVGYADGTISVMNLKLDECVMTLKQSEHGSVTSLSFRQDSVGGQLVSGTDKGDIVVWDLNKRVIFSFLKCAHPGGVGSMQFLDTLPIMVTSGVADNAISVYLFDKPDGGCRLLKERRGFTSDFCSLIPYGPHDLIVASTSGEVGKLNLIQSQQNKVWSQAKALQSATAGKNSMMPWKFRNFENNHLPEITSVSSCEGKLRHFDWPNVATTHKGVAEGYMWSAHQQALVTRMLIVPRKASTGQRPPCAVSVAVSVCGNYAALGLDNGEVHRFNTQSCYHRGLVACSKSEKSVVGMHFISSRDLIVAWEDSSVEILKIVPRPELVRAITCAGPSGLRGFNINGFLCAVWHANGAVSIVDIHADKIVRQVMKVGSASVSATAWAEGGKWLAIATEDKRMVIYDLPTASIVDRIEFSCSVKSMVFTHNNAQLVTAHEDGRGAIRVWQNLAVLGGVSSVEENFVNIDKTDFSEKFHKNEKIIPLDVGGKEDEDSGNFMRLWKGSSRTRWQQILRLDEIKERNRPLKPAEKPKSAPFFLPVKYQGVEPVFAPSGSSLLENEDDNKPTFPEVKRQKTDDGYMEMVEKGEFEKLRNHLVSLTPSGVHICLSELGESQVCLDNFIVFLAQELEAGNNLDLVASWTALFVQMHASSLAGSSALDKLETAAKKISLKFDQETNEIECLLKVTAALQLHR